MKESGIYIMLYDNIIIQGKKISELERETGISRNTIKKYLKEGEKLHKSLGKVKGSKLDSYKSRIAELMAMGIYNATVIYERIVDMGYQGRISILRDYIHPLRPPAAKVSPAIRRYETKPGQQAQMDWGILKYRDRRGNIKKVACFVMVLGYSRMRYVEFSRRCDEASLLRCMVNAFEYFGGIPEVILTDRMKTVIVAVDHGKPVWQEIFKRFASEMGFVPKVCRVRRPQTKGKVERLVHFVRDNFMAGCQFIDFGDLQKQAVAWCDKVNAGIHGTTGERPIDSLKNETLKPLLPESILHPYQWENRKVARDCFISYNGTRYGVPWRYCGQVVQVRQQGDQLKIESENRQIIQLHPVCHQARKHIWAKGQYDGLVEQEGYPYPPAYGNQIPLDEVEIRPLSVYETLTEVI